MKKLPEGGTDPSEEYYVYNEGERKSPTRYLITQINCTSIAKIFSPTLWKQFV